jgi:hypothetical protein
VLILSYLKKIFYRSEYWGVPPAATASSPTAAAGVTGSGVVKALGAGTAATVSSAVVGTTHSIPNPDALQLYAVSLLCLLSPPKLQSSID